MRKIELVSVIIAVIGLLFSNFYWLQNWNQIRIEADDYRQELDIIMIELEIAESELETVKSELETTKVPWIDKEDIRRMGIEVLGEVWDGPFLKRVKIRDYNLTPDELLLIFNVLSSLPPKVLSSINSITVVHLLVSGRGGLYIEEGNIAVIGTPDRPNSLFTARMAFISILYHEIGHSVYDLLLTPGEKEEFRILHNQSQNKEDYAEFYGINNDLEDFATIFKAYCTDTDGLLEKAEKSPILKAKVKFVDKFFLGYRYKVDELRGTIVRWLGENQEIWWYRSRTNPQIEQILGY